MAVRIVAADWFLAQARCRLPFRYGIVTMTQLPLAFVRVEAEIDGAPATGLAADGLPPKWFTKVADRPIDQEAGELAVAVERALALAPSQPEATTVFEWWLGWLDALDSDPALSQAADLVRQFAGSLVERALIDAWCRRRQTTLSVGLADGLGVRPDAVHPELAGVHPASWLPPRPAAQMAIRHTVGLSDPLTDDQIVDGPGDDLPVSLASCRRRYGLTHFKVKLSGEDAVDRQRLGNLAAVLAEPGPRPERITLDANEHFTDVESFRAAWERLTAEPRLGPLLALVEAVEQPLNRAVALDPAVGRDLRGWQDRPALIIDESDDRSMALDQALESGYSGTSHKNCKGVFKSVLNAGLLARRRAAGLAVRFTAEDLANIGPIALLQDLAVAACLGLTHAERNGHHYFRGLACYPEDLAAGVAAAHGDCYRPLADGTPSLAIADGRITIESVLAAPFGYACPWPVERFIPGSARAAAELAT